MGIGDFGCPHIDESPVSSSCGTRLGVIGKGDVFALEGNFAAIGFLAIGTDLASLGNGGGN